MREGEGEMTVGRGERGGRGIEVGVVGVGQCYKTNHGACGEYTLCM